jgi:copper chaperone NosL
MWSIELNAPQYPEGLGLLIYANKLGGNIDIINGLNHYIGMKTMHKEDFIEFTILPYAIIAFAVVFLIGFLINKRQVLYAIFVSFLTFGVISMADFWKWEYDYGHNLDPKAAIQIPGMSYQPPFLGFKQLLNFGAFSIPDIGGWIFIGVGLLLFTAFMMEWKFAEKLGKKSLLLLLIPFSALTFSCKIPVKEIQLGRDHCYSCKMSISDLKFAVVILTNKGRSLPFDDVQCMKNYISRSKETADVREIYVSDFAGNHSNLNSCFIYKQLLIYFLH